MTGSGDPTGGARVGRGGGVGRGEEAGAEGSEDEVVARIARAMGGVSGSPPLGSVWIGDDAAVVARLDGRLLLATDAAVAGVHADLSLVGVDDLGWKAMAATISDLGAMGGRPAYALVTVCLPPGSDVDSLSAGVAEASARWSCPVVGGDVTAADQLMVSVAVVGSIDDGPPAVTRAGAAAGDSILVTGPLGASAAGLRVLQAAGEGAVTDPEGPGTALAVAHRRPMARVEEGVTARRAGVTAMIDVSDGLSIDLHRLADASGVGFELEYVPVTEGATEAEALGGGEDYELVMTAADPTAVLRRFADAALRSPVVIGRCVADPAVRSLRSAPLARSGWAHRLT